jgi:hypothetical protein
VSSGGREEAPADLADGLGQRRGLEGEPADGASDAVGGDDEIVVATGSVAELDGDEAVLESDAVHGQPEADGHVARRLEQQFVQVGPMNHEAWPDGPPELGDVDLEEQPAALVAEALPWDLDGPGGDTRLEPERTEGASGVAGQIHSGTGRPPRRFAFDHLERDAGAARASARAPSRRSRPRRSGRAVRSPLHRPSCTTSHLAIAAGTLPSSRRESSSAGVTALSRNGSSRQALPLRTTAWSVDISNDDPVVHRYLSYFM